MLTIIPNHKAMNYEKLIDFLNKRKNIELNRFKQRGDKNIKDIEYRINKETNRPELLELLWLDGYYIHPLDQLKFHEEKHSENNTIPATIQELVANDILDLSQYMFLTHEYVDDGFDMEIVLRGIFTTLEEASEQELEDTVLPELDILEQAITNAQPYKIEQVLIDYLNQYGKKDSDQPKARVFYLDDEQNADYAIVLSYDGKALHSYMYCSLKHDDWESRIVYRDHFYDEEN